MKPLPLKCYKDETTLFKRRVVLTLIYPPQLDSLSSFECFALPRQRHFGCTPQLSLALGCCIYPAQTSEGSAHPKQLPRDLRSKYSNISADGFSHKSAAGTEMTRVSHFNTFSRATVFIQTRAEDGGRLERRRVHAMLCCRMAAHELPALGLVWKNKVKDFPISC